MITITITGRAASGYTTEPITTGSVGMKTFFSLSPEWDGLGKVAVFKNGSTSIDVYLSGNECKVPPEVLADANQYLHIGLYGTDATGEIVIPTVWCAVGKVVPGTAPSGVEPGEITPELAQQVLAAAEAAAEAASQAEEVAQSVRDDADEGKFDGAPGQDGHDGSDGYSPSATVEKTGSTTTITITDKNGTTTAAVNDGQDGAPGTPGSDGKSAYEIAVDEGFVGTESEWLESLHGADGHDGQPGADGTSPTASVSKSGTVSTLTVTDAHGTTQVEINDGQDGTNGQDGAPGRDGVSPTASVSKSGTTSTLTVTDGNGTTQVQIEDGQDGQDYILTNQDKTDIATIVVQMIGSADTTAY